MDKQVIRLEQTRLKKRILKLIDSCEYCGDTTKEILQLHHIKQVAEGGTNDIDNIIVLCPNCHTKAHRGLIKESELKALAHTALYEKAIPSKPLKSNNLASKIKTLLKLSNASHAGLAKHLGISKQALSNKFYRGSFSGADLIKIADYTKTKFCFKSGNSIICLSPNDLKEDKQEAIC